METREGPRWRGAHATRDTASMRHAARHAPCMSTHDTHTTRRERKALGARREREGASERHGAHGHEKTSARRHYTFQEDTAGADGVTGLHMALGCRASVNLPAAPLRDLTTPHGRHTTHTPLLRGRGREHREQGGMRDGWMVAGRRLDLPNFSSGEAGEAPKLHTS